jgi:RHS repeat-associated protein
MYDTRGRVTQETKTIGTDAFVTQWSYNAADMPVTMTYPANNTGGAGEILRSTYLPQGSVDTLCVWNGTACATNFLSNSIYDEAGRLRHVDLAMGSDKLTRDYYYNLWTSAPGGGQLGQILGQKVLGGVTTTIQNLFYTYDEVGNITVLRDVQNSNQYQCFTYDNLNRLLTAKTGANTSCTGSAGQGTYNETYTYHASNGNLASKTGNGAYTYSSTHKHAVASTVTGGHSATYDANGNMLTRSSTAQGTFTFTYDAENRLISVARTSPSFSATFTYDGDGNRIKATVAGATTTFVGNYFEWTGSTSTMVKYYFAGGTRMAMRTGGNADANVKWLFGDHLGSTSVTADYTGALLSRTLYKPWGGVRYQSGTLPTDYTYTGQYSHTGDFGLMFYNARWYDPALGRMAQADTMVPGAGNPMAWDRYAYGFNNPIKYIDPSGHIGCTDSRLGGSEACDSNGGFASPPNESTQPELPKVSTENAPPPGLPDAPPDFSPDSLMNGHPSHPNVDGLPDDGWEWGTWPGLGTGWKNKYDPWGTVYRPDVKNKPGAKEGEDPHWNIRRPGEKYGTNFPPDYRWGRGVQRTGPGVWKKDLQVYQVVVYVVGTTAIVAGINTLANAGGTGLGIGNFGGGGFAPSFNPLVH